MYRLLFVDDEEFIVQGLVQLIEEQSLADVEVCSAYSAHEALTIMRQSRIDIVITDIEMPKMNGLELQKEIRKQWPNCKVIILTGYDEFTYAHEAIRNQGFDYLLKTESDEVIVRTIKNALQELSSQVTIERLISSAKLQRVEALPSLRKDFFTELLSGKLSLLKSLNVSFSELQVPLDGNSPVLAVLGRIDRWPPGFALPDQALMRFSIQNIAQEFFGTSARMLSFELSKNELIWLIQPMEINSSGTMFHRFVSGSLESTQFTCGKLLKMGISFVYGSELLEWRLIAEKFDELKRMMNSSLGMGKELLLTDTVYRERVLQAQNEYPRHIRMQLRTLQDLNESLVQGDRRTFFEGFDELIHLAEREPVYGHKLKMELTAYFSYLFISFTNSWAVEDRIGHETASDMLLHLLTFRSWEDAKSEFHELANLIFTHRSNRLRQIENDLIGTVREYIQLHLSEDLSLTKIADVVSLSPSYLSRVYKQSTGNALSEDIADIRLKKSIEMLKQPHYRMHEISAALGFVSDNYFYRFFKKHMNVTPQEFRESMR